MFGNCGKILVYKLFFLNSIGRVNSIVFPWQVLTALWRRGMGKCKWAWWHIIFLLTRRLLSAYLPPKPNFCIPFCFSETGRNHTDGVQKQMIEAGTKASGFHFRWTFCPLSGVCISDCPTEGQAGKSYPFMVNPCRRERQPAAFVWDHRDESVLWNKKQAHCDRERRVLQVCILKLSDKG